MSWPTLDDARRLAEWRPPLGVISIYLRVQPDDRGGAWRTELNNGLSSVLDGADGLDHEATAALRATCERIAERFTNHERSLPRAEMGFVEVAAKETPATWWSSHLAPESVPTASFDERPVIAPLICVLERGLPRGVALLSGERVRLLEWAPGHIEELESWELSVFSGDWRERKAQRMPNPARAQAVSASGRDQFDERLEENRHRFLGECGGLASARARERGWRRLLLFGSADHVREFRKGAHNASGLELEDADGADLISEPAARVEEPIAEAAARLDAARERALVERALESARGGMRGSAGLQETEAALAEARVDILVLDAAVAASREELVRRALEDGARVVIVSGEAAETLGDVEGTAALLRY